MRCARCDGIVVPQAVGKLPDGVLVYGWCVPCLVEAGCAEIDPPPPRREKPRRPGPEVGGDAIEGLAAEILSVRAEKGQAGRRARGLRRVAWGVTAWSLALLATAAWYVAVRSAVPLARPFGDGTPLVLAAGGLIAASFGIALHVAARSLEGPRALRGRMGRARSRT